MPKGVLPAPRAARAQRHAQRLSPSGRRPAYRYIVLAAVYRYFLVHGDEPFSVKELLACLEEGAERAGEVLGPRWRSCSKTAVSLLARNSYLTLQRSVADNENTVHLTEPLRRIMEGLEVALEPFLNRSELEIQRATCEFFKLKISMRGGSSLTINRLLKELDACEQTIRDLTHRNEILERQQESRAGPSTSAQRSASITVPPGSTSQPSGSNVQSIGRQPTLIIQDNEAQEVAFSNSMYATDPEGPQPTEPMHVQGTVGPLPLTRQSSAQTPNRPTTINNPSAFYPTPNSPIPLSRRPSQMHTPPASPQSPVQRLNFSNRQAFHEGDDPMDYDGEGAEERDMRVDLTLDAIFVSPPTPGTTPREERLATPPPPPCSTCPVTEQENRRLQHRVNELTGVSEARSLTIERLQKILNAHEARSEELNAEIDAKTIEIGLLKEQLEDREMRLLEEQRKSLMALLSENQLASERRRAELRSRI